MTSDQASGGMPCGRGKYALMAVIGITIVAAVAVFVRTMRRDARDMLCRGRLAQISLALSNYHAQYGEYPPHALLDENGRALHSWRTLILPFLLADDIKETFRLSEPWDSPHNSRVAKSLTQTMSAMPGVYRSPTDDAENPEGNPEWTSFVAVMRSANQSAADPINKSERKDRREIIIIEFRQSGIHWMEPRDLSAEDMKRALAGRLTSRDGANFIGSNGDVGTLYSNSIEFRDDTPDLLDDWLPK